MRRSTRPARQGDPLQVLKWYSRITLALGLAAMGLYISAVLGPSGLSYAGGGSSAGAIAAFVATVVAGVVLAHSVIVALVFASTLRRRSPPASPLRKELRWHAAALALMGVAFLAPTAMGRISRSLADAHYRATPYARLNRALTDGTPAEVAQWLAQLDPEERTGSSGAQLVDTAVAALRLDKLQALQAGGVPAIRANDVEGWAGLVREAVKSETSAPPGARAALVRWLLAQGEPAHYSLRGHMGDMLVDLTSRVDYAKELGQAGLFDALVAHGADVNDCSNRFCPLWYSARFHNAGQVAFLLAHGAEVATLDAQDHTTALGEAIGSGDAASVKLLLAAGAQASAQDGHDDVVAACMSSAPAAAEIVERLLAAKARITPQRLADATAQSTAPQLACVRGFLPAQ